MIDTIPGFRLLAAPARLKDWDRDDLALVVCDQPAAAAGVFTRNRIQAAPVRLSRRALARSGGRVRAVLLNAGCANACTGREGTANAAASARTVAEGLGAEPEAVLLCSTGVIGRQLPMDRLLPAAAALARRSGSDGLGRFARAIMTTDLAPKTAAAACPALGGAVVAGACKGSGMIAPNMATMLAVVMTDARIPPEVLSAALKDAANRSFNNVTVDGDTSTNDTLLLLASGRAGTASAVREAKGKHYDAFVQALSATCVSLAEQIARDGEGATKLVRVKVAGAKTDADARRAAKTIAESPLVKTAMFGNDPNWGRVIAALGRSGAMVKEEKVGMRLAGEWMFKDGRPSAFDAGRLSAKMKKAKEIDLEVILGLGKAECTMLTCDFSYDYVKINADYTT